MATARLGSMPLSFIEKVCAVVVVVGFLNLVLFLAVGIYLGGDAADGRVDKGRYFLGKPGGTEVSKSVFTYSKWHGYSVWVTWPLMLAASPYLYKKRLKNFDPTFDKLARYRGRKLDV